jgi:ABC-type oligopeptide transport system substrate-binding subunit
MLWGALVTRARSWGRHRARPSSRLPAATEAHDWLLDSKGGQALIFNSAAYASPVVERLLSAGEAAVNPTKRFVYYSKALARIASDVPYVPVYLSEGTLALSSRFAWRGRFGGFSSIGEACPLNVVAKT